MVTRSLVQSSNSLVSSTLPPNLVAVFGGALVSRLEMGCIWHEGRIRDWGLFSWVGWYGCGGESCWLVYRGKGMVEGDLAACGE